jgi:hypothetical protein
VYLNLSIPFTDVFESAFDFGDVFWNTCLEAFHFGDVFESVLILVTCLTIAYLLVTCLNHVSNVMLINNCFAIW